MKILVINSYDHIVTCYKRLNQKFVSLKRDKNIKTILIC